MNRGSLLLSIILAMMLSILPLPAVLLNLWPDWLLLVLIYWLLQGKMLPLFWVWLLGLVQDLLTGTLLGAHAFIYVMIVYVLQSYYHRLRFFAQFQLLLWVWGISMVDVLLLHVFMHWQHQVPIAFAQGLLQAFCMTILWMVLYWVLQGLTHGHKKTNPLDF